MHSAPWTPAGSSVGRGRRGPLPSARRNQWASDQERRRQETVRASAGFEQTRSEITAADGEVEQCVELAVGARGLRRTPRSRASVDGGVVCQVEGVPICVVGVVVDSVEREAHVGRQPPSNILLYKNKHKQTYGLHEHTIF